MYYMTKAQRRALRRRKLDALARSRRHIDGPLEAAKSKIMAAMKKVKSLFAKLVAYIKSEQFKKAVIIIGSIIGALTLAKGAAELAVRLAVKSRLKSKGIESSIWNLGKGNPRAFARERARRPGRGPIA